MVLLGRSKLHVWIQGWNFHLFLGLDLLVCKEDEEEEAAAVAAVWWFVKCAPFLGLLLLLLRLLLSILLLDNGLREPDPCLAASNP